jgi:hypothetical protein
METEPVRVDCRSVNDGWSCAVVVGHGSDVTSHEVTVSQAELDALAGGVVDPTALVEASFGFLLERESRHSILRRFGISEIGRYFPEYPTEIGKRLAR